MPAAGRQQQQQQQQQKQKQKQKQKRLPKDGGAVWVCRTRRKPRSAVRPSRWRLCVRALAKQCFASKAPSPLGARWRHPWRQRSCPPTPPRL
ncbi:hypothetical protein EF148_10700 [Stenotrophomonas maltophilia]|nr:hypothetical protein [Stenotrophomonas maltophilia]